MNRKFFLAAVMLMAVFLAGAPIASTSQEVEPQMAIEAPDISFTDTKGAVKKLSDFKGKTVVLSFWASWCGPCLIEMPAMDRLQAKMGDKVLILPVGLEPGGSRTAERFYKKAGITHLPIYIDQQRTSQSIYQLRALPMTFVINSKGMIVGKVEGAMDWDRVDIQQYLEGL